MMRVQDNKPRHASNRASRICEYRDETTTKLAKSEETLRVEKRGEEWAIVRNSDNHPIAWCNTPQEAHAYKKIFEREYAREEEERKSADPAEIRALVSEAA